MTLDKVVSRESRMRCLRGFLCLLTLCLFGSQPAWAEETSSAAQGRGFSDWMTYYYVYKDAA
jgi:hypothetical protein